MSETILDGVRDILSGQLLRKRDDVRAESLLVQDLDVDSLGLIELTFAIEEKFGVEFPDLKTSAELLLLPLPDGLRRIEAMPGATTLFEFMQREVARALPDLRVVMSNSFAIGGSNACLVFGSPRA